MQLPTLRNNLIARWQNARDAIAQWWQNALERAGMANTEKANQLDDGFLPDFCSTSVVVNVVVIAEIFALVATLLTNPISFNILNDLILKSVFVQWIALASVAALCYS